MAPETPHAIAPGSDASGINPTAAWPGLAVPGDVVAGDFELACVIMNMARRGRGSPRPRVCPAPFGVATLKRGSPGAAPRQPRSSSHLRVGRSAKLRITSGRAGNAEGWKAATSTTSPRDGPLHRWHIWGTSGGTPGGHIWGPSAGSTAGGVLLCGELEEWFPSSHERRQGGYVLTLRGETKNIGLEGGARA